MKPNKAAGFTLIEMLVVIFLISTLAAMLFPVFAAAREKARSTVCASNLRQIGMAMAMYAQDADDLYPWGADPSDKYTNIWESQPEFLAQVKTMPLLTDVLGPYVKNANIWRCSSDTGFGSVEFSVDSEGKPRALPARPSAFEKYGSSYFYRTELALGHHFFAPSVYDTSPQHTEKGAGELNVLMDASGAWHGGSEWDDRRYNTLMGDGHIASQTLPQLMRHWALSLR